MKVGPDPGGHALKSGPTAVMRGFEPLQSGFGVRCSTVKLHDHESRQSSGTTGTVTHQNNHRSAHFHSEAAPFQRDRRVCKCSCVGSARIARASLGLSDRGFDSLSYDPTMCGDRFSRARLCRLSHAPISNRHYAAPPGLEPGTSRFSRGRSTN